MNKKVVALGGGTGMSYLLRGLKQNPLDITAVVSVCDDGGSTGKLRDEFGVVAVGDIRKVIEALSEDEGELEELLAYRYTSNGEMNNHSLGNLILLAAIALKNGSVQAGIESVSNLLKLKGKVMPFTEDPVVLIGQMEDGSIVRGEHYITESPKRIVGVSYEAEPNINEDLLYELENADLIVLSMGSLFTSVIPNLLSKQVRDAIDRSNAKIVYCCNLFTQPGETDNFKVSDHIKVLNSYLGNRKVEYVIANDGELDKELAEKYANEEQKDAVILDADETEKLGCKVISDDLVYVNEDSTVKRNVLRTNYLKLGFLLNAISLDYDNMLIRK